MEYRPVIQTAKCTGCGLCVRICPSDIFRLTGSRAEIWGNGCIGCDHCSAICPTNAVDVEFDAVMPAYRQLVKDDAWRTTAPADMGQILNLLHTRRSCRIFGEKEVSSGLLEDLVTAGTAAPSGSNCQKCVYTALRNRREVLHLGGLIADFYRRLNRLAQRPVVKFLNRLFGSGELTEYYRVYYHRVERALQEFEEEGADRLFHGAPAIIAIGADNAASCPAEDAILAASNILLVAHRIGLGSCMIGYAVEAGRRDRKVREFLRLSGREKLYAVIAIGYPAVSFSRIARKREKVLRFPAFDQEGHSK